LLWIHSYAPKHKKIIKTDFSIENTVNENLITTSSPDEPPINDTQSLNEPNRSESNTTESSVSSTIDVRTNETITDTITDDIPSPFSSPIKLEQIVDNGQSTIEKDSSTDNPSEFFYDFQQENFHAEQVR
jgi:hypothetical protein